MQGLIGEVGVLEQPAYRKLACCWLPREAKAGGGGAWGFAQYRGPREWDTVVYIKIFKS